MLGHLGGDLVLGLVLELDVGALLLVVDGGLDLTLGLQGGNDVLILPSDFVGETSQHAKLAVGLGMECVRRYNGINI